MIDLPILRYLCTAGECACELYCCESAVGPQVVGFHVKFLARWTFFSTFTAFPLHGYSISHVFIDAPVCTCLPMYESQKLP